MLSLVCVYKASVCGNVCISELSVPPPTSSLFFSPFSHLIPCPQSAHSRFPSPTFPFLSSLSFSSPSSIMSLSICLSFFPLCHLSFLFPFISSCVSLRPHPLPLPYSLAAILFSTAPSSLSSPLFSVFILSLSFFSPFPKPEACPHHYYSAAPNTKLPTQVPYSPDKNHRMENN